VATIYTRRFLMAAGGSGSASWQVPVGKLAVITSVVALNGGAAGGYTMVSVAGVAVWIRVHQATNVAISEAMRLPVYAGELITALASQLYMTVTISGYLFDSDPAREQLGLDHAVVPFTGQTPALFGEP
jgi:hypothetical protein